MKNMNSKFPYPRAKPFIMSTHQSLHSQCKCCFKIIQISDKIFCCNIIISESNLTSIPNKFFVRNVQKFGMVETFRSPGWDAFDLDHHNIEIRDCAGSWNLSSYYLCFTIQYLRRFDGFKPGLLCFLTQALTPSRAE